MAYSAINMSKIEIRPLVKEDIPFVAELEARCFSMPFTEKALNELFLNTSWHFFVATDNNTVVGYISFYCIIDETEIANVCVMPDYRGKGLGRALTKCAIDFNKEINGSRVMLAQYPTSRSCPDIQRCLHTRVRSRIMRSSRGIL